jgi:hypothetical protein
MHYVFSALSWMFIAGLVGSAVVILLTFIDDLSEIFTDDQPSERSADASQAHTVPVQ